VDEITFRVAQRKKLLIITACCLSIAIVAALVIVVGWSSKAGIVIFAGMVSLLMAPMTLNLAVGKTTLRPGGLATHRLIWRRNCQWDQVADIVTKNVTGHGGTDTWIMIHRTSGKPFKLVAPFDSTNGRDVQFQENLSVVRSYWVRQAPDARRRASDSAAVAKPTAD
jgi:hypothetical protein